MDLKEFKDLQYDKLAAVIRDSVDMEEDLPDYERRRALMRIYTKYGDKGLYPSIWR